MPSWEDLFDKVREQPVLERPSQINMLRRMEFDRWALGIVPRVMRDVHTVAQRQALQFLDHTGATVNVAEPEPPQSVNPRAPWLAYITLSLGETLLHLYATRGGGARLSLHMLPDDAAWAQKNQRVVSHAGCFVVRQDEGYELHYLRGDPGGGPQDVMSLDTLVFRAFELLVQAHVERG